MPILFFVYFVCGFVVWMFFCLYIIFCAVYYFISHLICHQGSRTIGQKKRTSVLPYLSLGLSPLASMSAIP